MPTPSTGKPRGRAAVIAVAVAMAAAGCSPKSARSSSTTTSTVAGATTTQPPGPAVHLALGDGKVTTSPQVGSIFACSGGPGGPNGRVGGAGAFKDGPWIKSDGTWVPSEKPQVKGSVSWPQAAFSPSLLAAHRVITGNDLPLGITTGTFPIASSDPAYQYDRNPNSIRPTSVSLSLPAQPAAAATPSCLGGGPIGIITDGVYLFDALDAQNRDAPAHEVLDRCGGHPQQQGTYHYHSLPDCFATAVRGRPALIGYALDGFGIFVESKPDLTAFTNADLDVCHGRVGNVTWDGQDVSMYHYVVTAEFPYTLGCYRGTPSRVGG